MVRRPFLRLSLPHQERPSSGVPLPARRAAVLARAAREIEAHRAHEQAATLHRQEQQQRLQTSLNSSAASLSTSSSAASLRSSDSPRRKKAKKQRSMGDESATASMATIPPTPPQFVFPQQPTPVFERTSSQGDSTASLPTVDPMRTEQYKSVTGYRDGYSDSLLSKRPSADDLESDSDPGLDTDFFEEDAFYSESRNLDDWNVRFQEAQSVIQEFDANTNLKDRIGVNVALIHLYQDFLYSVRTYGRIIISELYLPPEQRTIRPSKLGGVAGGVKYLVNNILFKFAINHSNLYADDSAAAKVAGLELKSLISYLNCEISELHYPLMALVDYRGFRLVAMSLLPIGKETIVYGTDDAGATIHSKDQRLSSLMERAARKLNLQPHRCADLSRRHFEVLHSAADIEGHKGTDGRYYVIDFSRTFPPENPDKECAFAFLKMSHLFQLFRPEFVHSYKKPLCSDAFSKFVMTEELKKYNEDIREATESLHTVTIPRVVIEMEAELKELLGVDSLQHFRLIENVHSSGVNVRYLGRVRSLCKSLELRAMILVEVVARLLKSLMRLHLREMMKKLRVPLEQPYRRFAVDYLNLVFGNSEKSTRYWNERLKPKLRAKFAECLTEEEASDAFCLKQAVSAVTLSGKSGGLLVFEKVSAMMGLQFSPVIYTQLSDNPAAFLASAAPFDYVDLEELREIVKHTNVMAHSQGYLFKMKGLQRHQAGDFTSATRFFRMAIEKCEESLNSNPNHKLTLRNCGQLITFVDGALLPGKKGDFTSPTMKRADRYFRRAIKADPTDAHSTFQYARFLNYCNAEQAEEFYLRTLELDPTFERCLHEYAEYLAAHGSREDAHKIQTIVSTVREMVPQEGFKSRQLRLSKSTLSSSADASVHGSGGRRDHHMRTSERDGAH